MSGPTRHTSFDLTDECSLNYTIDLLGAHFSLEADGYRCKVGHLWRVLLYAATTHRTIEAACASLAGVPDANTVRGYLQRQLHAKDIAALEQHINQCLDSQIPAWMYDRPQEIALDVHDQPYYGRSNPEAADNWVCRGQARKGTTRFYRCASAYAIRRDVRVTLGVVFMRPGMTLGEVVERLLSQIHTLGIRIKRLYADKAFRGVAVLRYLQDTKVPAIIAAPLTKGKGGLKTLCQGRRSYRTSHTFRNPRDGEVTVDVVLARTYDRTRSKHRRARWCAWICLDTDLPPHLVRASYRHRFGIETSYRQMEQVRARTTSLNPALRFLLTGLAFILSNVCIALHWLYLRISGPGPRRVARSLFPLYRLQDFLIQAIQRCYGSITAAQPSGP